jgi:MFS family permease
MSEFAKGWKPLAAATIGTMCGIMTITIYTQGFFVGPVTKEFGWSPGQFFLGFTIVTFVGFFFAPIIGVLAKKYGIRLLGMLGLVGHAVGYVLLSYNPNSLILWYLSFVVLAIIAAGTLPIIWTAVLNGWFVKKRGLAVGITMCGTGIGAFLFPPIVDTLIQDYGWRIAYRSLAIGAMVFSLPIVYFLFKENESVNTSSDNNPNVWGFTRSEAIKTLQFWLLCAVLFFTAFVVVGLISNFKRILLSFGVEPGYIPMFATVMGGTVIVGRLLVGALIDKFWAPLVGCIVVIMPIIAMLLLLNAPFTLAIGIFFAIAVGLASGAELDMLAYLTSRYFGTRNYTEIFGLIFAVFSLGSGFAPSIAGQLAENMGNYDFVLYLFIAFLVISIPLFLFLGPYPKQGTQEAEA